MTDFTVAEVFRSIFFNNIFFLLYLSSIMSTFFAYSCTQAFGTGLDHVVRKCVENQLAALKYLRGVGKVWLTVYTEDGASLDEVHYRALPSDDANWSVYETRGRDGFTQRVCIPLVPPELCACIDTLHSAASAKLAVVDRAAQHVSHVFPLDDMLPESTRRDKMKRSKKALRNRLATLRPLYRVMFDLLHHHVDAALLRAVHPLCSCSVFHLGAGFFCEHVYTVLFREFAHNFTVYEFAALSFMSHNHLPFGAPLSLDTYHAAAPTYTLLGEALQMHFVPRGIPAHVRPLAAYNAFCLCTSLPTSLQVEAPPQVQTALAVTGAEGRDQLRSAEEALAKALWSDLVHVGNAACANLCSADVSRAPIERSRRLARKMKALMKELMQYISDFHGGAPRYLPMAHKDRVA